MKYHVYAKVDGEEFEFFVRDNATWLSLFPNTGAITLGKKTVFIKRTLEKAVQRHPDVVGHEAVHVYQARKLGWRYLVTYVTQAIKAKFVKDNIPMEREAYSKEHEVFWKTL